MFNLYSVLPELFRCCSRVVSLALYFLRVYNKVWATPQTPFLNVVNSAKENLCKDVINILLHEILFHSLFSMDHAWKILVYNGPSFQRRGKNFGQCADNQFQKIYTISGNKWFKLSEIEYMFHKHEICSKISNIISLCFI